MFKIIVAGSRSFQDYGLMVQKLDSLFVHKEPGAIQIVSGTAQGADRLGERYARQRGLAVKQFPADWDRFGNRAAFVRNEAMAEYADALVLFWDGQSHGSAHMLRIARERKLQVRVVRFGSADHTSYESDGEEEPFGVPETSLFIHDNREQLRDAYDNSWISREDYLTADPVAYGEGWEGMANHVHNMSGLDRIIFEDCTISADNSTVMAPHLNLTPYPYWLRPEYIARKTGCDLHNAADLLDCWVILDSTHHMVETFIAWTKTKGTEASLRYFEKLAFALAEAENIDPEDVTECQAMAAERYVETDPDTDEDDIDTQPIQTKDPVYTAPDVYQYHVIGQTEPEPLWIDRQPKWYQSLIQKVRSCTDLDVLTLFGKGVYSLTLNYGQEARDQAALDALAASLDKPVHTITLTHDQAGVFWTEYNLRKAALEKAIKPGPVAKIFINRIAKANGKLASLGAWLYKVQHGQVAVQDAPQKHEWTMIWNAYQLRKQEHSTAASAHA